MSADILLAPSFVPPARCRGIRGVFDAGVKSGRITVAERGSASKVNAVLAGVTNEPLVRALPGKVADALRAFYPDLPPLTLDLALYTRLTVGGGHDAHADAVKLDGTPNHTPDRVATGLVYLTQEGADHDGGVLELTTLGRSVPPAPGLLVGMRTGLDYTHRVTTVTRGIRDALAFWFKQGYPAHICTSSENHDVMGWKALVFAHSCHAAGIRPFIYVHGAKNDVDLTVWHLKAMEFANVIPVPNYATSAGGERYPPRNTAGTLFEAAKRAEKGEVIVVCDGDLLVTKMLDFRPWTAARCDYLADKYRDRCPDGFRVAPPYVVPQEAAAELAGRWLKAIDTHLRSPDRDPWITSMLALPDAARGMGIEKFEGVIPVALNNEDGRPAGDLAHYGYETREFKKNISAAEAWKIVPTGRPGTVLRQVTSAVHAAAVTCGLAEPAATSAIAPGRRDPAVWWLTGTRAALDELGKMATAGELTPAHASQLDAMAIGWANLAKQVRANTGKKS